MKKGLLGLLISCFIFLLSGCTTPQDEDPIKDATPPVIDGVHNLNYTTEDDAPDYMDGITASDDTDGTITNLISVDASSVDLTIPGEYTITYTVTDAAGNETTETCLVTVTEYVPDYQALAEQDVSEISLPSQVSAAYSTKILSLPKFGTNGTSFVWSSSDPSVITLDGLVLYPSHQESAKTVTLTARVQNGTYITTESYSVVVQPYDPVAVTSMITAPFTNCEDAINVPDVSGVKLFYVDDGSVPYIDVETFVTLIDNAVHQDASDLTYPTENTIQLSYDPIMTLHPYYSESDSTSPSSNYEQTMTIDFANDTVTVSSYLYFLKQGINFAYTALSSFDIDDYYVEEGDEVTIPYGEYHVDFVMHEEAGETYHLMPLHIISHLFYNHAWYYVIFNGDTIYGGHDCLREDDIFDTSVNDTDVPYDMRLSSYYFYQIVMEYFSGHKYYRDIDSYNKKFVSYAKNLMTSSSSQYYRQLAYMVNALNDIHSSMGTHGYYSNSPGASLPIIAEDRGSHFKNHGTKYDDLRSAMLTRFGASGRPSTRYISDSIAVIYFDRFEGDLINDIVYEISNLDSSVDTIVFDLTLNTGGYIALFHHLLAYLTDDPIEIHNSYGPDGTNITYTISENIKAYNYDYYIMTSNVSWSAASIFSLIAQNNDIATIIGQDTYGGTSAMEWFIYPCGYSDFVTGLLGYYHRSGDPTNGYQYVSLEEEVVVDIVLNQLYNDEELLTKITEHQSTE